jgi:hypothetical protein
VLRSCATADIHSLAADREEVVEAMRRALAGLLLTKVPLSRPPPGCDEHGDVRPSAGQGSGAPEAPQTSPITHGVTPVPVCIALALPAVDVSRVPSVIVRDSRSVLGGVCCCCWRLCVECHGDLGRAHMCPRAGRRLLLSSRCWRSALRSFVSARTTAVT